MDSRGIIEEHLRWEQAAGRTDNTIKKRRLMLTRMAARLPVPIEQAEKRHLADWQVGLDEAGLSSESISTYVGHARAFYRWLLVHDRRGDDPSRVLARPPKPKRFPRPAEEPELHLALMAGDARMRAMIALMAFAGLRCCEVSALDRADVHEATDPPYVLLNGKGGKQRVVPLTPWTLLALREHGLPLRGWVFRGCRSQQLKPNNVSKIVGLHLHEIGLQVSAHQLRHYYGTTAMEESGNLRMVQELMGHESPTTTAIYTRVRPLRCGDLLAALDRHAADVMA